MKKEELKQFLELHDKFEDTCSDICHELSHYDNDFSYVEDFYIDENSIRCEGDEYWSYGGYEHHTKYFDIKLLTYSDDELKEMFLVSIIRIRTLNIFSTIYKMCIIDDKYVKSIKNKTIKIS